jgi:FtsZ-interacting cell division protein ZipA
MKDLQVSLLIMGAAVVAGVYAFNLWQERQFRRRAEQAFARDHADVLLQDPVAPQDEQPEGRVEPTIEPHAASPTLAAGVPAAFPVDAAIDPVIDYVAEVGLASAGGGDALHEELRALAAGWGKAVLAEGYDPASGEWREAGGAANFSQLRLAVQLSNRAGCIELNRLAAFRDAVEDWVQRNGAVARFPDVADAHAMAVQLDRFCADVDIAVGINVVTRDGSPFAGARIRALAEAAGLRLEADGVFYARDERGAMMFTLDNHEPMPFVPEQMKTLFTSGVTFLLDVPRVADVLRAFDGMLDMARDFAETLGGMLVDDNRSPLTDAAIEKIRDQLQGILAKMEAGHIAAGGARALRLFS